MPLHLEDRSRFNWSAPHAGTNTVDHAIAVGESKERWECETTARIIEGDRAVSDRATTS